VEEEVLSPGLGLWCTIDAIELLTRPGARCATATPGTQATNAAHLAADVEIRGNYVGQRHVPLRFARRGEQTYVIIGEDNEVGIRKV
jgi:hypothetical protein